MSDDLRSTKRCRRSSSPDRVVIVAPGDSESSKSADGHDQFTRHADFWLEDGNLILLAARTAFRVYRGLLVKKSAVFADMFVTGSPDANEMFDGCPVIRLPDHPDDLQHFLQYLMPCSPLR